MKIDFGVGMGRDLKITEIAGQVKVAEECGFSHATFLDQNNFRGDVYVMMTVTAMSTQRIRIGQGVTNPFTRHPAVTANATAVVNELSGNRVFLGIGAGMSVMWTMGMKASPLKDLREAIIFMRKYMSGEEAEYKSAKMHSEWIRNPLPIYMAASGPRSCQLAGEVADGVMVLGIHPEIIKWHLELIERGAQKAGRNPADIDVWVRTMCYISDSKEEARREVAPYVSTNSTATYAFALSRNTPEAQDLNRRLEKASPGLVEEFKKLHDAYDPYRTELIDSPHDRFVTQRMVDFFVMTGTRNEICDRIRAIGELGVKTISLVDFSVIDKEKVMKEISTQIMPEFQR